MKVRIIAEDFTSAAGGLQILPLVTKAGGIGTDDTLIACVQALTGRASP